MNPSPDVGARTFDLELPPASEMPPPEGANFFNFTISGPEVEFLVGYIPLRTFLADNPASKVRPEITHRFFLSLRGYLGLRLQMLELEKRLKAQGVNLEDLTDL